MIHKKLGGSTAARLIGCPAWINLSADIPKGGSSNTAADTGTLLHNCMEELWRGKKDTDDLLSEGREYNGIHLDAEMVDEKLLLADDAVMDIVEEYDLDIENKLMIEPFMSISEDIGGSIDWLCLSGDGKTVVVLDYKFGYITVSAKHNAQLLFYALAAATDEQTRDWFDEVEQLVLVIVQPNGDGPVVQQWTATMGDLDEFETQYLAAVEASESVGLEPNSGRHCMFCPAAAICPAKTGEALKASRITELNAARLAEYLPLAEQVTAWAAEVKKMAHQQLELGVTIQGYKLVAKRATRKWAETDTVEEIVRRARKIKLEEGFDYKLKSPPQLEKVCKKKGVDFNKIFSQYISAVSSGTTMAPEDDPRPAALAIDGLEQLNALNL
tara:strand:- start:7003 stop:8157 length:1155 start_codon:yes stop_codon:yes gene_type:complete